jgi:hypothetical protein
VRPSVLPRRGCWFEIAVRGLVPCSTALCNHDVDHTPSLAVRIANTLEGVARTGAGVLGGPVGVGDCGSPLGRGGLPLQRVGPRSVRYGADAVRLRKQRLWVWPIVGAGGEITMAGESSGATQE